MNIENIIKEFQAKHGSVKLDLACGDTKFNDSYIGIDIAELPAVDYVMDLSKYPWPIPSGTIDEINCSHYIEHIKHDNVALDLAKIVNKSNSFKEFKANINKEEFVNPKDGFIKFFNEVNRILKRGGIFRLVSPYYTSIRAYGDPTHVRHICDWSFYYLNKSWRETNKLSHYGIEADFDIKVSYYINNDMTLKSEEVRNKAFLHDWNAIEDIIVELTKK